MGQADSLVMEYLPWPFTVCATLQYFTCILVHTYIRLVTFVRFGYKGTAILSFRAVLSVFRLET
jgi:hypothetical protein